MSDNETDISFTRHDFKMILLSIVIGITTFFGIDMHLPSLPTMVKAFHTTSGAMQNSITVYLLGMVCMSLINGPLSDALGRRPVIIGGMIVAVIGSILCIMAHHVHFFLFGRLVQGIGASVGLSLGRSIIADSMNREKIAAFGSFGSVFVSMGIMISPVIGGYVQTYFGWHAVFVTLSIFFIIAMLIAIFILPETNKHINPKAFHPVHLVKNYAQMIRNPIFIGFTIASGVASATAITYTTVSPFLFQIEYHLSPIVYGWLGVITGVCGMLGKTISAVQVRKTASITIGIWYGLGVFVVMGLVTVIAETLNLNNAVTLVIWICLITGAQGFVFANAMGGALSEYRHMGGAASALYGALQFSCGLITAAIIAFLPSHGADVLGGAYIILGFVGFLVFFWGYRYLRK